MKRILWLSRHEATEDQVKELSEKLGDIEIIQVSQTVKTAEEVLALKEENECEEMVVVLPINLMAELTTKGIKPLRAVMIRQLDESGENAQFIHSHFERVCKIYLSTEIL